MRAPSFVIARQCARRPLCHCEAVRTPSPLSLRTSPQTGVAISDAEQRISWHKKIPTAVCALPRNDGKGVIANQRARRPLCHCEAVLRLVWQSSLAAGTEEDSHGSDVGHCLGMTGEGVIARQCAHCRGNLRSGQPGQSAQRTKPDCFQRAKTPQNAIRHLRCMGSLMEGIIESSPV